MKTIDYQNGYIIASNMTEQEFFAFKNEWENRPKKDFSYIGDVLVLRMPPDTAWGRLVEGWRNFARRFFKRVKKG